MRMKNLIPPILRTFVAIFTVIFLLTACHKEIKVPAHANKGQNYLYLKIDNTENVIQEGIHFKKNMKGELYGGSESDYKPEVSFYEVKGVRSCIITCGFSPKKESTLVYGYVKIYMDYVNEAWVPYVVDLKAFGYSDKHEEFVSIYETHEREEIQNFHLERLDEEKQIVSFSYQCDYEELSSGGANEKNRGNVYLYVDFKFGLE
jgi:hypothetical protein